MSARACIYVIWAEPASCIVVLQRRCLALLSSNADEGARECPPLWSTAFLELGRRSDPPIRKSKLAGAMRYAYPALQSPKAYLASRHRDRLQHSRKSSAKKTRYSQEAMPIKRLSGMSDVLRSPIPGQQFSMRLAECSGRRASTSASQACGSTSLSFAVAMRRLWQLYGRRCA